MHAAPSSRRQPVALRAEVWVVAAVGSLVVAAFAGCGARNPAGKRAKTPVAVSEGTGAGAGAGAGSGAGAGAGAGTGAGTGAGAGAPKIVAGARSIKMTLYHVAGEPCPDVAQVPLPKCGGGSIAMVSSAFKKSAAMQGTSKLCDGRVVGVQKTNPLCFVVVAPEFPWGMTASGRPATPFRSIAVDPSVFPLGRWYYVAALDGLTLPAPHAGAKHDGCVRADDTGGAVKGTAVDLFVGPKDAMAPLVPLLDQPLTMAPGDSVCGGDESF